MSPPPAAEGGPPEQLESPPVRPTGVARRKEAAPPYLPTAERDSAKERRLAQKPRRSKRAGAANQRRRLSKGDLPLVCCGVQPSLGARLGVGGHKADRLVQKEVGLILQLQFFPVRWQLVADDAGELFPLGDCLLYTSSCV